MLKTYFFNPRIFIYFKIPGLFRLYGNLEHLNTSDRMSLSMLIDQKKSGDEKAYDQFVAKING